jgi:hypothetical protein
VLPYLPLNPDQPGLSASDILKEFAMPNHWVVGAMWGGRDDQFELFVREGCWRLGWVEDEQPIQARRVGQIRKGDRIAIKKRSANDRSAIQIRAIGFVTGIDTENHQLNVQWMRSDLNHEMPARGCFASIHGPFSEDEEWTRRVFQLDELAGSELPDLDDTSVFGEEGTKSWRLHLVTERNRQVVESKKAQVKSEQGSLECEICGFNFATVYGELGVDFCEVHHKLPLSQLDTPVRPKLDDLAIICSNCHRMIHRTKPLLSVEDFRAQLKGRSGPVQ